MSNQPLHPNDRIAPESDQNNHTTDFEVWTLPNVENTFVDDDQKTNALGKKKAWRYEPPEETEISEAVALTAEEIDEIRQAAVDEGFNQGKEEGFAKGYDEGKNKGHEEGLEKGHEKGLSQGLEEGKEKITALKGQWQALIEQLHQPLTEVEENIEAQLLELVVQLTEAVVLQEAKTNPEILIEAISTGIKALPSQEAQTQIYLNPEDIVLVEQEFSADYVQESGWRLLPAPQLERGGCQVENSTSNIDLRMKSRLKQVLETFLQNALSQS